MNDNTSSRKSNATNHLTISGSDVAREDLTRFIEWQARFKIAPDDPLYGLVLAVRATLQNSVVASHAAVQAVAANEEILERFLNAREDLACAFHEASAEARDTIEKTVQQASRKISNDFMKTAESRVNSLTHAANRLEIQGKRYRDRVLADATASFVTEVRAAAVKEFEFMTWRSRAFVAIATVGFLLLASGTGFFIAKLNGHHLAPYKVERLSNGKPNCGLMEIVGVGEKYACIVHALPPHVS